jgi:hypothetical protein
VERSKNPRILQASLLNLWSNPVFTMRKGALIGSVLHLILPLASAVSLTDFQKLTVKVTLACDVAYDRTIPSCTVDDFKTGATCSSGCVSGLNQIASGVVDSCSGTVVGSSTLLGRIFSGAIVSSLCPNNGQSTSAAQKQSPTAVPATTAETSAQVPDAKTSSSQSSVVTSSSSPSSATSSSGSSAAQSSSPTTEASSSTPAAGASTASFSKSSSAAAQTSHAQSQPGNGRSGMTVQQQQIAALANSGGGSPFDIVGYSAASHPTPRDLVAITLGLALLIMGWCMR